MGRDAAKACENQCFRCRKEAAKHNDKLGSREGAAELLGISVSSLADYELGNTKVIPVDKVVLMADIYNAPELMAWYCSSECLIGKSLEMPSPEIASVERTTMKLLKQLRQGDIEQVKEKLIDITADGIISKDEWADLTEILDYLDGLIRAARELKLIGSKLLNGGADDGWHPNAEEAAGRRIWHHNRKRTRRSHEENRRIEYRRVCIAGKKGWNET